MQDLDKILFTIYVNRQLSIGDCISDEIDFDAYVGTATPEDSEIEDDVAQMYNKSEERIELAVE